LSSLDRCDSSPPLIDVSSLASSILTVYYYWVNMTPVLRGTSSTGMSFLIGTSLACGLPVSAPSLLQWRASGHLILQWALDGAAPLVCVLGAAALPAIAAPSPAGLGCPAVTHSTGVYGSCHGELKFCFPGLGTRETPFCNDVALLQRAG
jgi:hypothetical protein